MMTVTSQFGALSPDRREPGHLLQITQVHPVQDNQRPGAGV